MTAPQGPALPETCCATLWLWPGQALYSGPSLRLDPHSGSVSCLAVGADAPFTVHADGHGGRTVRSALVGPRLRHRVVAHGKAMVFCYLDPASARERACRAQLAEERNGLGHGHRAEERLAGLAPALGDPAVAAQWLDLACPAARDGMDPRIAAAASSLRAHTSPAVPASELAAGAGLSVSRFLHLFREHTGTSFRRYRLWARMLRAGTLLAEGSDLTTAAADAGFASASHFSDSFHSLFGLAPTRLLATGVTIRVAGPPP
ncbi:AraC family transcriptional regulator [Prauserella muralis]|uniref:DNA-binding protein n=1 Tax=Prauserella muralis TaxID=588067 RepID=A0A2V4B233_9PSEU|nr:helix-turn-helix domain-containing protein [Prauserella muralis]PXY28052.1 DNA-binding protein [Prauserella muralis]TWE22152.1 AraC family transcriptional regulator [Prauserella muralis]